MFYIYILQSLKDKTFYIGLTSNLENRLKEHNNGKSRYTKGHIPYKIIYTEEYLTIKEAKEREKSLKRMKNTDRFLKMIGSPEAKLRD